MKPVQFSLLGLLGLVGCVGMACAAVVAASPLCCGVAYLITIIVLCVALLGVVYRSGIRRAFWVGFTIFGWGYLVVVYGMILVSISNWEFMGGVSSPVDEIWVRFYSEVEGERPTSGMSAEPDPALESWLSSVQYFKTTGNLLLSLFLGLFGGYLGRWFYLTQERANNARPQGKSPSA